MLNRLQRYQKLKDRFQIVISHLPDLKSPVALVCGSREMIAQTRDRLQQMGFPADAILTNY